MNTQFVSNRDPLLSWYFLNRSDESLHRNRFSVELRGNGEFFSILEIDETVLEGWSITNERISDACRGWCDGYKLCVRGHKDSMLEAARWIRQSILGIAADMTADLCEVQASLGVVTQVTSQEAGYEVDAIVFQLVDLVGRDAGLSEVEHIVRLAEVGDEAVDVVSSNRLAKLDSLFSHTENGYAFRFPIDSFLATRDLFRTIVG